MTDFTILAPNSDNAVKHLEAERRQPSGEFMAGTHRKARALPLQRRDSQTEMLHSVAFQGADTIRHSPELAGARSGLLRDLWRRSNQQRLICAVGRQAGKVKTFF